MKDIKISADLDKYSGVIEQIKLLLEEDLSDLSIDSAIVFGSSTYGDGYFIDGESDLDICAFTNKMTPDNYTKIVDQIKNKLDYNFLDKPPVLLNDHIADRIEFTLQFPEITVDMNIMPPGLPRIENVTETAAHDSLELFFANFYQYGIPFIGHIPSEQDMNSRFLPFYDDELRGIRLGILTSRIQKNNQRLRTSLDKDQADLLYAIYRSREYFLKWLFIYNRKYPLSLWKHLENQLSHILKIDKDEIDILLFRKDVSMLNLCKDYLDLTNRYLEKYNQEKDVKS